VHKSTHTAAALDPVTNSDLGSLRIDAALAEYRRMLAWAKQWPQRQWAVENAEGLGHHLTQWLVARGEVVLDVPTTATARVRELSRSVRRKNDRINAAGTACVAAAQGDARSVVPEDHVYALGLLDERRMNLSQNRTRAINQLHRLLREPLAGAVPTELTAAKAAAAVRAFRPSSTPERVRLQLCRELIADVRRLDQQLADNQAEATRLLDEHGTRLREIDGVGPVLAARILGRRRHPSQHDRPPS
jgi:transposase